MGKIDLFDKIGLGCAVASVIISAVDHDWTETIAWSVVVILSVRLFYNDNDKSKR